MHSVHIILSHCKYHHISLLRHSLVNRYDIQWCLSLEFEGSLIVYFHVHCSLAHSGDKVPLHLQNKSPKGLSHLL